MYKTFLQQLEQEGMIEPGRKMNDPVIDRLDVPFKKVFEILNSPDYLAEVPPVSNSIELLTNRALQFMNHRGTWDNIRLVVTSLVLLNHNYLTADEIKLAIDAYTLQCRDREKRSEFSVEYLELTFEIVQKALRLMGKAISEKIYNAWVQRMEPFLMCYDRNRLEHQYELQKKEKEIERDALLRQNESEYGPADGGAPGAAANTKNSSKTVTVAQ